MKKKAKLFTTIASLCMAVALMAFGVYAASKVGTKVSSNVSYRVTNVYVDITYSATGACTKEATKVSSYTGEGAEMKFQNIEATYDFGDTLFTEEQTTATYTVVIKNAGKEKIYYAFKDASTLTDGNLNHTETPAVTATELAAGAEISFEVTVSIKDLSLSVGEGQVAAIQLVAAQTTGEAVIA